MIDRAGSRALLEVDGGVKVDNAAQILAAGADVLVAGSAIFTSRDYAATIAALRAAAATAGSPRTDRLWVDISSLIDSLHPLEIKVLTAFEGNPSGATLETEQLASATGLEPSQLSMAIEWLLAKSLLVVDTETVTPVVSLTSVGEQYHAKQSPIERVLAAARAAAGTGQRLTIQDLQSQEGLDPSDVSKAVGQLKKEGVVADRAGRLYRVDRPSKSNGREDAELSCNNYATALVNCRVLKKQIARSFRTMLSSEAMPKNRSG